MDPAVWGMIAVVVIGATVVASGWARDRRRNAEAVRLATEPPRPLPGVPESARPHYLQDAEILAAVPATPVSDADAADLLGRRQEAPALPGGVAETSFLNVPDRGMAILRHPSVIVIAAGVTSDRQVNTLLAEAARRGRPLVIVAPEFSPAVLGTLRANAVKGTLPNLPVPLTDATAQRQAVALTGGRLVEAGDLTSGWLPDQSWGTCEGWIADEDSSWIIVSGRHPADSQPPV